MTLTTAIQWCVVAPGFAVWAYNFYALGRWIAKRWRSRFVP